MGWLVKTGAAGLWSGALLLFFWGTEALLLYFAWQTRNSNDSTFLAAALVLCFWSVVCVLMSFRMYKRALTLFDEAS